MRTDLLVIPIDSAQCIQLIQRVSDEMCDEINATGFYEPHLCDILMHYTEMLPKLILKELGE